MSVRNTMIIIICSRVRKYFVFAEYSFLNPTLFIINEVSYIFIRIYKHTGFCTRARGTRRPYFYRIIFPQTMAYFYLFIFSIFFFFLPFLPFLSACTWDVQNVGFVGWVVVWLRESRQDIQIIRWSSARAHTNAYILHVHRTHMYETHNSHQRIKPRGGYCTRNYNAHSSSSSHRIARAWGEKKKLKRRGMFRGPSADNVIIQVYLFR